MKKEGFLTVDLGASGGKAFIVRLEKDRVKLEEIHRFKTSAIDIGGITYWDVLSIHEEILKALGMAVEEGAVSIGIDSWGVDFALLDENGFPVGFPMHYRNAFKWSIMDEAIEEVGKRWIFDRTPTQFQPFNTLYQLIAMKKFGMRALSCAKTMLGIPSLFTYFLTNEKVAEFTWATTTQLYNPKIGNWDKEIPAKFGIPNVFPAIVRSGTEIGKANVDGKKVRVVLPASHDTASAFACVAGEDDLIISTGTWFLIGIQRKEPVRNEKVLQFNFANEGCVDGTYRLIANSTGMWIVEELKRKWRNSYAELFEMAKKAKPFACMIDVDSTKLQKPLDMEKSLTLEAEKFSSSKPLSKGECVRCALEGIALKVRLVKEELEEAAGAKMKKIRMLGGAIRSDLVCQFVSNATGLVVEAGPIEATATGNGLAQMVAQGHIETKDFSQIVRRSFEIKKYEPSDVSSWNAAYEKYKGLLKHESES